MLFGSSKVIKIEKQDGLFAWDVNLTGADKKQEVKIANGIQCVRFVDGVKVDSLYSSATKTFVNTKEGAVRLVAVDIADKHTVRCGCSDVSFTDYEINMEGTVGMNAVMTVKVINAMRFVDNFPRVTEVTETVVEDFFRTSLVKAMTLALRETVNRFGRDAENQIYNLGNQLKAYLEPAVRDSGLGIEEFSINSIYFSPEYERARKAYFEKKEAERQKKKEQREEQEEQDRELDVLERLSKMRSDKKTAAPAAPTAADNEGVYCPICGHKNRVGVTYCEKCGNKIK